MIIIQHKEVYKLESVVILPVIITATGLINKHLKKYLEKIELPPQKIIPMAQKSVILETCIVRTALNI